MIELSNNLSLTEMVDMVLDKSGILDELKNEKTLDSEIRIENLNEFKSITKNYEEEFGIISIDDFLNEISLVSDISEHQDGNNKVSLMTIHSVKGLEFDYVFLIGMEEGIFPHYNSINEGLNAAIEEERRLCYVAITRAKKKLTILNARRRMLFGQTQTNMPSRFIEEIDKQYLDIPKTENKFVNNLKKIIIKDQYMNEDADYKVGDLLVHDDFGEGVVISVDKSIITIAFAHPYGIKKLMKKHKSLHKK